MSCSGSETCGATTPGQCYKLTFHYARNNGLGRAIDHADVEVAGDAPLLRADFEHNPARHPFNAFLQFDGTFTADGKRATLRFTSLNVSNAGVALDAISTVAVPVSEGSKPYP